VWAFWRPADTIFLPNGAKPDPWVDGARADGTLYRPKAAWRQNTASENFQAFSGPLVDQNGKWVRYEVMVNKEEFDYFYQNELYNLDGQAAFSQRPENNQVAFPASDRDEKRRGAVEIKLAWKELGPGDDPSRFYTTKTTIVKAEAGSQKAEITAGLVGMHIAMPTRSSPEWIWATFEQIDNTRERVGPHGEKVHASFFDSRSKDPPNKLADRNAAIDPKTGEPVPATGEQATTWTEKQTQKPVQVKRVVPKSQPQLNPLDEILASDAHELNEQVQSLLRKMNSVFQYYELIDTQWPVHPNAPAIPGGEGSAPESITHKTPGDVVPVFLTNSTMETFFQKGDQPAGPLEQDDRLASDAQPIDHTPVNGTESCVGCHYSAGICLGFRKGDNGAFLLDPQTKQRIPIFGENAAFGKSGNADFSWLLQIEGRSQPYAPPGQPASEQTPIHDKRHPSRFLEIRVEHKAHPRAPSRPASP
jgi:hypothetical protein